MGFRIPQNPGIGGLDELTDAEELFIQNIAGLSYASGDVLYHDGTDLQRLAKGTNGQFLKLDSGIPAWETIAGGGDMLASTYDPATVSEQLVGLTAIQTLTNKTLTSPKINEDVAVTSTATELNLLDGITTLSGSNTGDNTVCTSGTATTASTLATPRTIGGVSFDGSANIVPNTITIADESTDETCFVGFFTAATGGLQPKTGTNLTFNSANGVLTATGFAGALTGNVTGNVSGSSGSCTGESATVATIAGLAPNTATTQATQASITTCANLVTVGTIGTGAWEGTAINQTYLVGQSGTNTGDNTVCTSGAATTAVSAASQVITDNAIVTVDDADAADNDYAKFTAAGVEGRSYAEVLSDIGAAATAQTFYIGTTQVAINRASASLTLAGLTLTTPDIGTPSAGTLTNCTASSTSQKGPVELATTAEINTGTDSTRAMPVDQFVASKRNVRWLVFNLVEAATDCATATNIAGDFVSPIAGTILQSDSTPFYLYATNSTAGTTGTMVVDVSINGTSIMTTNKLDFDTGEKTTTTAATPPDLTTTALAVGNIITIDIDAIHTTAAKGLTVFIGVRE